MKIPTYEEILPYIEKKLVSEQVHPEDENVRIFNYTHEVQFSKAWDDITRQCRGLILNIATGEVIARPFPKFFNYQEHVANGDIIPDEEPIITEKLDGSLGILYELNGKPWIATRGSFLSDQALWATDWYRKNDGRLPLPYETNLFEIIYPENRIVVSYDFSGLVHLATLETKTGTQFQRVWGGAVRNARIVEPRSIDEIMWMDEPNSEGFVVFYPNTNFRMKIKFPEYVRLHRIVTGVNEIAIWEFLRDGKTLDELLAKVPDEFYAWVTKVKDSLMGQFNEIQEKALEEFSAIAKDLGEASRKEYALRITKMAVPAIGFSLYDGKPYAKYIWQMVRPHGGRVFKVDMDA